MRTSCTNAYYEHAERKPFMLASYLGIAKHTVHCLELQNMIFLMTNKQFNCSVMRRSNMPIFDDMVH